jgi:hypothetical protein
MVAIQIDGTVAESLEGDVIILLIHLFGFLVFPEWNERNFVSSSNTI